MSGCGSRLQPEPRAAAKTPSSRNRMPRLCAALSRTTRAATNISWRRSGRLCTLLLDMDHEALAKELIRALRGRRSQVALSRRLKHRSNVLYAWEAGLRAPTAAGFLGLAKRVGIDIDA